MKIGRSPKGFTLVETLTVLAITGVLFVLAFINFASINKSDQFKTAVFDLQTQLEAIIANAENGQYNANNTSCIINSGYTNPPYGPPVVNPGGSQGTNTQCEYIGVGIKFQRTRISVVPLAVEVPSTSSDPIYNLSSYPVSALAHTINPVPLPNNETNQTQGSMATCAPDLTAISNNLSAPDNIYKYDIEEGISLDWANTVQPPPSGYSSGPNFGTGYTLQYIVALAYTPFGTSSGGSVSMEPYIVWSPTTTDHPDPPNPDYKCALNESSFPSSDNGITYIADYFYGSTLYPAYNLHECFNSRTTTQSALFNISASQTNGGLGVTTTIYQDLGC